MPVSSSPSDYTNINVDYSQGRGFYTDKTSVSDLLQIPAFTSVTNPTDAQIGSIIKRTEGIIDDMINRGYNMIGGYYDEEKEHIKDSQKERFEIYQKKYNENDKHVINTIKKETELLLVNIGLDNL